MAISLIGDDNGIFKLDFTLTQDGKAEVGVAIDAEKASITDVVKMLHFINNGTMRELCVTAISNWGVIHNRESEALTLLESWNEVEANMKPGNPRQLAMNSEEAMFLLFRG